MDLRVYARPLHAHAALPHARYLGPCRRSSRRARGDVVGHPLGIPADAADQHRRERVQERQADEVEPRRRHTDRTHLDLWWNREGPDLQTEVERLISLGATRVDWDYPPDADFVVLADTEDNLFCAIA